MEEAALRASACCCTSFVPQSAQNLPGRPPTLQRWQYPALAAEEEEEEAEEATNCGQVVRLWPLPPQLLHGMALVVPQSLRSVVPSLQSRQVNRMRTAVRRMWGRSCGDLKNFKILLALLDACKVIYILRRSFSTVLLLFIYLLPCREGQLYIYKFH